MFPQLVSSLNSDCQSGGLLLNSLIQVSDSLFVCSDLGLEVDEGFLLLLDSLKILLSDIVIVLFHFPESHLVVVHQIVYVLVFALFNLVNLNLHSQLKLIMQLLQLVFVRVDQLSFLEFQSVTQIINSGLKSLLLLINISNIVHVFAGVVVLHLSLLLKSLLLILVVMVFLMLHVLSSFSFHISTSSLMLVLQVLDLLNVRDNLSSLSSLGVLHFCVEIANAGFMLSDLFTSVVVKVVNHVFFNLEHVSLDLLFLESVSKLFNFPLKLFSSHWGELVFNFGNNSGSLLLFLFVPSSRHFEVRN